MTQPNKPPCGQPGCCDDPDDGVVKTDLFYDIEAKQQEQPGSDEQRMCGNRWLETGRWI